MGFWQKIFRRKKNVEENEGDWANLIYSRDKINIHDEEQRTQYVTNCLEQIVEASKELDLLSGEYNLVTSYLTDMEEIESLPEEERETINIIARQLNALEQDFVDGHDKKKRISDEAYYQMRKLETEIEEGIRKLKEAEKYGLLIKQDLQRLDGERHAYDYRKQELDSILINLKGMAIIFLTALVICLIMLVILQFGLQMNTSVGYILSVIAGALAITAVCIKYIDAEKELVRVEKASNKLIQLQNKVKIRYVNNINLLDYLYIKYSTDSVGKLERKWKYYQEEKETRKQYAESEAKMEYYRKQLVDQLNRFRVKMPGRWVNQVSGLLDKREMVENRHELILRRQALRKQMDYNSEVAKVARREITDIVVSHPKYADEITQMIDRYERQYK